MSMITSLDWGAALYAAGLASAISWATITRTRREGKEAAGWQTILADTVIGGSAGVVLTLFVPEFVPQLARPGGVTALAALGGAGGRRVYDLGLAAAEYLARLKVGLKTPDAAGGGGSDGTK